MEVTDSDQERQLADDRNGDENEAKENEIDDSLWNYVYVPYAQEAAMANNLVVLTVKKRMRGTISVRPFRKYAIYVKADLMVDTNWAYSNRSSAFEYDKVISGVVLVTSLPARKLMRSVFLSPPSFLSLLFFLFVTSYFHG